MTAQVGGTASSSQLAQRSILRRELRQRRIALTPSQCRQSAQRCVRHALKILTRRKARRIAVYLACGSELSTAPLISALHRAKLEVFVPRLVQGDIHMVKLRENARLRRNLHRIAEPYDTRHARRSQLDAVLMPLTAFDSAGNRLGSGGGYYDRFFAGAGRKPWRLGYAYAVQQCDALPTQAWDVPLHAVCTERGVIRF